MLSLELARKLKEAGLKPECADFELFWLSEVGEVMHVVGYEPEPEDVWLPGLDRLLAEIERRGWYVAIQKLDYGYEAFLYENRQEEGPWLVWDNQAGPASSWEDAAGEALLWILEWEKGGGS
jgi:hypothetical protein